MTAAPAASHSLAVATSSSRVTGRPGTFALSASAPVGATVMSVLAAMARRLPSGPRAALIPGWRLPSRGLPGRQRKVLAGEGQRLGQVGQAGLAVRRLVGVHLDHHRALVPGRGQQGEQLGARLAAAPGHQVLVRERPGGRPGAVGQVHVGQPAAELGGHGQGVRARGGGVRQVQGDVRDVERGRVPVRGVRRDLAAAHPQRVHVLHREDDIGPGGQLRQALLEAARVVLLPAERRVHHDHRGADPLGQVLGSPYLLPRLAAPDALGEQQARRVHGHDGQLVIGAEPVQRVRGLAHRVGVDHDLDPVVAQAGGDLEGLRRAFRVDRGGGQGDGRTRDPRRAAHYVLPPSTFGSSLGEIVSGRRYGASMAKSSAGTAGYRCSECGWQAPKWTGRCGECQAWGTVEEAGTPRLARAGIRAVTYRTAAPVSTPAVPIGQVDATDARACPSGLDELDRVLGGGLVPGAVLLLAGEPGVGKSTLLLETGALVAEAGPVLYVTGEESAAQVRSRADRIGAVSDRLFLAAETDLDAVLGHVDAVEPRLLIIDSVQTIAAAGVEGSPGGVTQVRAVASALISVAKERSMATILVGHVTKDGSVAGPRALEHLVDVVLYFDGDRHSQLRMVRAVKNRYGPTDEVGCFDLGEYGLIGLPDPSGLFLSQHREPVPGTCVTVTLEGRRPLLAEVQALVGNSVLEVPRRTTSGLDAARVGLVLAVLQRRAGLKLGRQDVYAATVGGVRLTEPSVDLAVAISLASSAANLSVPRGVVAIGEVGLAGEVRRVAGLTRRLAEAERMGFRRAVVPAGSAGLEGTRDASELSEVVQVEDIRQALAAVLGT